MSEKAAGAYRTIGELSQEIGVRQHILRYWETRFPQLRPLQRAGGRRYYRPEDVALVRRINDLLNQDGYTVRGVQALLNSDRKRGVVAGGAATGTADASPTRLAGDIDPQLRRARDILANALATDAAAG